MKFRLLVAVVGALVGLPGLSSAGQWDPREAALSRCEQELTFQMARESNGRQPDALVDERGIQYDSVSNSQVRLRGNGRFIRDHNDRGRDFTFSCQFDNRSGQARVSYNWSGNNWNGGGYFPPGPDYGGGRPPSGAYPPSGQVFFSGGIVSRNSNKCLDVQGASSRENANVQQWGCSGGANQKWDIVDLGRGQYSIISQNSNKALTVSGGGDGANVEQNRYNGGANQRWRLERAGNGAYRIINLSTNSCLDVEGAKRDDGANIQMWGCSGGANQTWLLRK
jgi:hypothetical protein